MTDRLDAKEFMAGYLAEAEEHLALARTSLTAIDAAVRKDEPHPRAVRELFRSLHTIKGLSAMVGVEPIVDVSHELETLLRAADKAGGSLPGPSIDEILRGVRFIEEVIARLSRGQAAIPAPRALLEALASLHVAPTSPRATGELSLPPDVLAKLGNTDRDQLTLGLATGRRAVRVEFAPSAERARAGVNITSVREKMATVAEIVKVLPRTIRTPDGSANGVLFWLLLVTDATDEVIAEIAGTDATLVHPITLVAPEEETPTPLPDEVPEPDMPDAANQNVVRVDVRRLDEALECLATLVVSRSRLERAVKNLADQTGTLRDLNTILAEGGRYLRDLRGAIMRARMVSVAELLDRAPLLVRGLSRSSQKRVGLVMETGRSELDKAVADRLFPAIVHLLRNAVDHAIETPEERRASGKPEEGVIQIHCAPRSGSQIALIVSDDGRGMDRERIARRARAPVPESDAELFSLIARPGFSTLDKATHTSGRGLGMDIVKKIIVDDLGGDIQMQTALGEGTTFTLLVPLSITILDVFSFACGTRTFVVPVGTVEELAEIEPARVSSAPNPNEVRAGARASARLFQHRGALLPLYTLSSMLGCPSDDGPRKKAIIVRRNAESVAFEVDRMLGQKEVVVRPVDDPLVDVACVSGTTDLGDGRPTLMLDLLALARGTVGREARA